MVGFSILFLGKRGRAGKRVSFGQSKPKSSIRINQKSALKMSQA